MKLVGMDALSASDRLKLETARSIREDFLHQNAFHETDTYTSLHKQYLMMKLIFELHDRARVLVAKQIPVSQLKEKGIYDLLSRMKYDIPNDKPEKFDELRQKLNSLLGEIEKKYDM